MEKCIGTDTGVCCRKSCSDLLGKEPTTATSEPLQDKVSQSDDKAVLTHKIKDDE
jgi:hypothetical protein